MAFPNNNGSLNYKTNYHLNLSPWVLTKNTYNRNGTLIYDVSYNPNRILTTTIIGELDKNKWRR